MLGRQQIAGVQNAIGEVFKNAHDAYATGVRVDYFEAQKLILIRDNGTGMTRADFENKWLVLGTESKLGENSQKQYHPPELQKRPVTGEKGIGRLAIALLGRVVLVLTRARRENGLHDLVVCLVHWGLFELPGLNLDDIDVPVETFPGGSLPSALECTVLTENLKNCVHHLAKIHPELDFKPILRDLDRFKPDPVDLEETLNPHDENSFSLSGEGSGTHFIIAPATPIFDLEISGEEQTKDYGFRKFLLGFYNQSFLRSGPPAIETSFRVWKPGAAIGTELLETDLFFTPREVREVDHHLKGYVDEYGQFSGSLRVYDKLHENLNIAWKGGAGRFTECGPFEIEFGYLMGSKSESSLAPDDFDAVSAKVERLGGMYIYRDNIRVLPYGDHSFDWLEVEKRRNLGAGYYFFSFRRMFGAVLLTREQNGKLVEKAGREGWQQNNAYRQLREININLLLQIAQEFFRKGGTYTELFEAQQSDLRRKAALLEKRERQISVRKKKFAASLDQFFSTSNSGSIPQEISSIRQEASQLMQAAASLPDQDQAATALIRAEKNAQERIRRLRDGIVCRRPAGVGIGKQLQERWNAYQVEKARIENDLLSPLEKEISESLGKVARQARIYIDQRRRLQEGLKSLQEERQRLLRNAVAQARTTADETRDAVFEIAQRAVQSFDGTYRQIETDLERINLNQLDDAGVEELRRSWELRLLDVEQKHRSSLEAARDMLSSLASNLKSSDGAEPAELMEAMDERISSLEEQADEDFEMVQLGLAVAIINHEFGAAISNVRKNIKELGFIARGTKGIRPLYDSIRSNFEHLDGHLGLFTPLQRRLNRQATKITGKHIDRYIHELFSNRIERHSVTVEATERFLASSVECYPSTIYPVIINIIDNAIHWLKQVSTPRRILLDVNPGALTVSNNGPSIPESDQQGVFQRGFSRRPNGRGLGLFIGKKALQKEEMDIMLAPAPPDFSVSFRISIKNLTMLE